MYVSRLLKNSLANVSSDIYIAPNLTEQKEINILMNQLPKDENEDYIVGVYNAKVIGGNSFSAFVGIIFFEDCLYYANKGGVFQKIKYEDMAKVTVISHRVNSTTDAVFWPTKDKFCVVMKDGHVYDLIECLRATRYVYLKELLNTIIKMPAEAFKRTRQNSLLHELPEVVKYLYVCVLYNYRNLLPANIQAEADSLIRNIVTRIELTKESRAKAFRYANDLGKAIQAGYLVKKMEQILSDSEYEVLRYSLLQDILYLQHVVKDTTTRGESFVNGLKTFLGITDSNQLDVIIRAVTMHDSIAKQKNKNKIDSEMQKLQEAAVILRIPISALFSSGSCYSAATFNKLKRFWNDKKAVNLQREMMLQEVILNNQKTINALVEDMNQLSLDLMQEIKRGNITGNKIELLSEQLAKLSYANKLLSEKSTLLEKNLLEAKLSSLAFEQAIAMGIFAEYGRYSSNDGFKLKANLNEEQLMAVKYLVERLENRYA